MNASGRQDPDSGAADSQARTRDQPANPARPVGVTPLPDPIPLRFVWSPRTNDFPVGLLEPPVVEIVRREPELPWYVATSAPGRRLPARVLPPVFAVAVLAGGALTSSYWIDKTPFGREQPAGQVIVASPSPSASSGLGMTPEPTPSRPTVTPEPTPPDSLLGLPGQGGTAAAASPTPTITAPTPDTRNGGAQSVRASGTQSILDLAAQYGLAPSTLVWANRIDDPALFLAPQTEVIIPPVDGVLHRVVAGDTLASIAATYGVEPSAISGLPANGVANDSDLREGLLITVPGGVPVSRASASTHIVKAGETLSQIAGWYGLDSFTLAFANDLPSTELIQPGQQLTIPPAPGLYLNAAEGDTVESIAARYGVGAATIRGFALNGLAGDAQPAVGQALLIPGATLPREIAQQSATPEVESVAPPANAKVIDPFAPGGVTGAFDWPTYGYITTEFGPSHNGLDIANLAGTSITAAGGGVVTSAGWNEYGLGYAVSIDHGNGYVTWYGHLSEQPVVSVGQQVNKGDLLGLMGSTGKSTGPHLHFIVMRDGAYMNPTERLPAQ